MKAFFPSCAKGVDPVAGVVVGGVAAERVAAVALPSRVHVGGPRTPRAVFKEDGPLVETRRVLSLLYSLNAEGFFLVKVHPFREKL